MGMETDGDEVFAACYARSNNLHSLSSENGSKILDFVGHVQYVYDCHLSGASLASVASVTAFRGHGWDGLSGNMLRH